MEFARLNHGGWIGPLASYGGRLFAVTNAFNGSLWDITDGGDLTSAEPVGRNLFPMRLGYLEGLAFDAEGNAYITNSEVSGQPIAVVAPEGSVSYLPDLIFDNARGLAVLKGLLFIAEGSTGRVLAYDLTAGKIYEWATGFTRGGTNIAGSLVVDRRGRLLMLWSGGMGYGLFDITEGGDFAGQRPLVPASFYIDVNQMAVDSANNLYVAGGLSAAIYISQFDGKDFAPFEPFVTGMGDTESVAVLLP